ncbi:CLUMA_CG016517, isoform B [Clunio marinus]|uniref:CLUMA_CG016517, isoform B n=1 Tax=Clunio marinus TaxID=568069 RepID=A0A1J1IXI4_9DIPT|nr:CLUMA_CG016517, isoform B [Clunio marinus]
MPGGVRRGHVAPKTTLIETIIRKFDTHIRKTNNKRKRKNQEKMSESQQNYNGETSSNTSQDQQTQGSESSGKWMTQAEYAKYKQEDSNANNYYEFSKEATVLPVAWDGKFQYDPNNVYIKPNRNASSTNNFYGFYRSFVVANNQPNSCHIIFCSDGFCKMTGYTRAEIMQRNAVTDFLHGELTSKTVCADIKDSLKEGQEKHFEILYYKKDGCESENEVEKRNESPKAKNHRRKRKTQGHKDTVGTTNNINTDDDDETESQLQYEESPVNSNPLFTNPVSLHYQAKMRRRLQFFFMNPVEKWQAKRRFPYKFVVQVIKIILVTLQLCLFAHSRYNHVNYSWDNRVTFSHLFLKGWAPEMEVSTYPPETGPLSVYTVEDYFDTIDYAIYGFGNLSRAIGPYSYATDDNTVGNITFCLYEYKEGIVFGFNESYVFNPEIVVKCLIMTQNDTVDGIQSYLHKENIFIQFSALVKTTIEFSIKTINLKASGPISAPDCYQFDIAILFDNTDHDGQVILSLEAEPTRLFCEGDVSFKTTHEIDSALRSTLNVFVIIICLLSFGLCGRAIFRAQQLRMKTEEFFLKCFGQELSRAGRWEFVNFWYIMICFNDVLLVLGSAIKEQIERKHFAADEWNTCSLLLGIGNLLVWFGVLRYLGFFKTYNVVILTLKKALPHIWRFLLCALLIYAGFTFCGWLILGPYHIKFRSLSTTSECLFSLINGDDMFATFTIMSDKSTVLWWFCRIYLYTFISLYIYVVLSLFISVIMDSYDTIKKYYIEGFPQSDLRRFIGEINLNDFSNGVFRDEVDDDDTIGQKFLCSEVIAPIRSEVDDISFFIINFEDLSDPQTGETASTTEENEPIKLTKFGRARASFRQSFRFGNMALRDRGHRLAGYLTPPSDATEQEEEAASERVIVHCDTNSDKISQTTVLRIEPGWDNNSAPALIKTKDFEHKQEPIIRTDETKNVTSTNKVYPQADPTVMKPEFQQTKSLDFETKGLYLMLRLIQFKGQFTSCLISKSMYVDP